MTPGRIVSVCLKGFPGADRALANLSETTRLTRHVRLASPHPDGAEVRFLADWLREKPPRLVLFGGWSPAYAALAGALSGTPGLALGVYWTSSGGQTDISAEIPKLAAVLSDADLSHLLFCSPGLAEAFSAAGFPARALPLTLPVPAERGPAARPPRTPGDPLVVSLLFPRAEARRKNVLNALLALAGTRDRPRLVLNGLARHPDYRALLDALRLDYEDRGWMERRVYEETLSSVDLGLQLSFAESFDYVAAEHLVRGVPVLGSRMVPVLRALSPETRRALVVDEADEVGAIREALQNLLDAPERCAALGARARAELLAANETNQKRAREVLCDIAGEPEGRERR